jgi:hypothetical protein
LAPSPERLATAPASLPGTNLIPYAPAGTPAAANPGNLPPARIAYLQQLAAQQPAGPPTPDPATLAASQAPQPLGNVPEESYGMGPGVTSDENEKNDFGDAKPALLDFMGQIGAHSYRYKDPSRDGEGTYTTPMAQELQKTDLGKQAVVKTPHGLGVDYQRLGGVNLAALSVVHRENQRLQSQIDEMRSSAGKGKR